MYISYVYDYMYMINYDYMYMIICIWLYVYDYMYMIICIWLYVYYMYTYAHIGSSCRSTTSKAAVSAMVDVCHSPVD